MTLTPENLANFEELAALAEGKLPEKERERVLARIADDDEALALVAELMQLENEDKPQSLAPHRGGFWIIPTSTWMVGTALAACCLLAIGLLYRQPSTEIERLLATLPPAALAALREAEPLSVERGDQNGYSLDEPTAFALGALDIDLRATLPFPQACETKKKAIKSLVGENSLVWLGYYEDLPCGQTAADLEDLAFPDSSTQACFEHGRCLRAGWSILKSGQRLPAKLAGCDLTAFEGVTPDQLEGTLPGVIDGYSCGSNR